MSSSVTDAIFTYNLNLFYNQNASECLKPSEELIIRRGYEEKLRDFCMRFKPALPNSVIVSVCEFDSKHKIV